MRSFNENNKRNIAKLLSYILKRDNNIADNLRKRLMNELLWSASADYDGRDSHKYKLPIWSQNAIDFRGKWLKNGHKGLRHEHIYPKSLAKDFLLKSGTLSDPDPDDIYCVLHRCIHGAVITIDEDKKLSEECHRTAPNPIIDLREGPYLENLFSRYTTNGINLRFVKFIGNETSPTENWYVRNKEVNIDFINNELNFDGWN